MNIDASSSVKYSNTFIRTDEGDRRATKQELEAFERNAMPCHDSLPIEYFAVIDDVLVWHGGMNLLGREDAWDNLMRIRSEQVAAELLAIAFGIPQAP